MKIPLIALTFLIAGGLNMEVTFENKEAGYFLKPLPEDVKSEESEFNRHVERFTVLNPTQINMIRVSYGPFTAKQTVPAMALLQPNHTGNYGITLFDVSAHVVTKEIRRDQPLLRVLFHLGIGGRDGKTKLGVHLACITLIAEREDERLTTSCIPSSRDGTCLAELTIPAHWWPPLDQIQDVKVRNVIHIEYALVENECSSLFPNIPSQPTTRLEDVILSNNHGQYLELKQDEVVRILVPQSLVYPRSRIYVPVYMYPNPEYPVYVFVLRARVKNGLKILGAQSSQPDKWTVKMETNVKQTLSTVTAFVKYANTPTPDNIPQGSQEVFSWLFEVDENASTYDSGRITWNLRYVLESNMAEQYNFDDNNIKMTSQFDIQKDDIQAVLPIAKNWEMLNTAVLNGRQVYCPMKVYIVSQAGKVADVTVQSLCKSVDESIIKVSSSCTSVYLDGSEIRGSHNATIVVNYGSYTGEAKFMVWIPELPLDIQVTDTKLSQIKGWKVPVTHRSKIKPGNTFENYSNLHPIRAGNGLQPSYEDNEKYCHLRFQQTSIKVFARFFAVDDNSGRESYLLNRKASLAITELVENSLRVADPRIASLKGLVVQGNSVGRTEIQVLSPITGRVIGAKEIRVGNDKVIVDKLQVTLVTGLQLSIQRDEDFFNSYMAQTIISHKLTAQYQEGLLDIRLHFSDGTSTSISDIKDSDYHLLADSLDSNIIAFAPKFAHHHPRVIAVSQGKGDLLLVRFEMPEICQKRRTASLASAKVYVDVDFYNYHQSEDIQNDGQGSKETDIIVKIPSNTKGGHLVEDPNRIKMYSELKYYEPTVQARQTPIFHPLGLTPLEIGMYALLGIFCIAIITFVISCGVYAVRYRRKQLPAGAGSDSVTNAHDWVWLGRTSLENNIKSRPPHNGSTTSEQNAKNRARLSCESKNGSKSSSNRSSNVSFPESEISIRITSNPHIDDPSLSSTEKCPTADTANVISDITQPPPPVPERRVRIQSNPISISSPNESLKQLDGSATYTVKKPPIPPHGNNSPQDNCSEPTVNVKNQGVNALSVNPSTGMKLDKNIGSNMTDAEWEAATMGMNYDQLIEYFENLKESNA